MSYGVITGLKRQELADNHNKLTGVIRRRGTIRRSSGGDLPFLDSDLVAGVEFDESLVGASVYYEETHFAEGPKGSDTYGNLSKRATHVRPV